MIFSLIFFLIFFFIIFSISPELKKIIFHMIFFSFPYHFPTTKHNLNILGKGSYWARRGKVKIQKNANQSR